jgi:uncharacterized protein (TIGR03437 family)
LPHDADLARGASGTVYVTLYGTGIQSAQKVQVSVAGQSVPVLYSGAQGQYQGLDQIDITLPSSLTGAGEASFTSWPTGITNVTTISTQ